MSRENNSKPSHRPAVPSTPDQAHKGGPIIYMVNNEHDGPAGSTKPLSLGDLWYGLDEVVAAMEGCLDTVEELEKINMRYELRAPFLMMRQTLKFGLDRLFELAPCADKRGRGIYADKTPDGQKTISYGIPDRKGGAA